MNIIVTGSISYDRIMDFPGRFKEHILPDKIHILNVSFTLNRFEEQFGGTAGNIAYNLKLLGLEPMIVAATGRARKRTQASCPIFLTQVSRLLPWHRKKRFLERLILALAFLMIMNGRFFPRRVD